MESKKIELLLQELEERSEAAVVAGVEEDWEEHDYNEGFCDGLQMVLEMLGVPIPENSRIWLSELTKIDLECALQYEDFLGRKLKSREEYEEIDRQVDGMILDWDDAEEFFKDYPELKMTYAEVD